MCCCVTRGVTRLQSVVSFMRVDHEAKVLSIQTSFSMFLPKLFIGVLLARLSLTLLTVNLKVL